MPLPIPQPGANPSAPPTPAPPAPGSYWTLDLQPWRVEAEQMRHNQVLYSYGEFAAFFLMWTIQDFNAGLVGHCQACYGNNPESTQGKIAAAYGQPTVYKCPTCYGTTFEGGVRAVVLRPSLWDSTDPTYTPTRRGEVITDDLSVETTSDFTVRNGDYVARGDGTRWQLRTPNTTSQMDGFNSGMPTTATTLPRAQREDPASVAYTIPPLGPSLSPVLKSANPAAMSALENINGPLVV